MIFRNTIQRVRYMIDAWHASGSLYQRPKVISRHEANYRPWFKECLDAARQKMATLGAEELDRVSVIVFWRGYEGEADKRMARVDIDVELHEKVLDGLYEAGVFQMYPEKLLQDCQQGRQPGATLVIAFNETGGPGQAVACVAQILKNERDVNLDQGKIVNLADVDEHGNRPRPSFGVV